MSVSQHPVKRGGRHPGSKGKVYDLHVCKILFHFFYRSTFAQDPGDDLERSKFQPFSIGLPVKSVSRKIQACHSQPFFIHRFCIQRKGFAGGGHADHGVVPLHLSGSAKFQKKVSGSDRYGLPKGNVQIQIPSKIKIPVFISDTSTHKIPPFTGTKIFRSVLRSGLSPTALFYGGSEKIARRYMKK